MFRFHCQFISSANLTCEDCFPAFSWDAMCLIFLLCPYKCVVSILKDMMLSVCFGLLPKFLLKFAPFLLRSAVKCFQQSLENNVISKIFTGSISQQLFGSFGETFIKSMIGEILYSC